MLGVVGTSRRSGPRTNSRLSAGVDQHGQRRSYAGGNSEGGWDSCFGDFPVAAWRRALVESWQLRVAKPKDGARTWLQGSRSR
jgi:hypothetical protein